MQFIKKIMMLKMQNEDKRFIFISKSFPTDDTEIYNPKYRATFNYSADPHPSICFGDKTIEDYTQHNNKRQKELYIEEYPNKDDWENPYTSGFWNRWLLWNEKSLDKSIESMNNTLKTYKYTIKDIEIRTKLYIYIQY
jgi:hypothetical protein